MPLEILTHGSGALRGQLAERSQTGECLSEAPLAAKAKELNAPLEILSHGNGYPFCVKKKRWSNKKWWPHRTRGFGHPPRCRKQRTTGRHGKGCAATATDHALETSAFAASTAKESSGHASDLRLSRWRRGWQSRPCAQAGVTIAGRADDRSGHAHETRNNKTRGGGRRRKKQKKRKKGKAKGLRATG